MRSQTKSPPFNNFKYLWLPFIFSFWLFTFSRRLKDVPFLTWVQQFVSTNKQFLFIINNLQLHCNTDLHSCVPSISGLVNVELERNCVSNEPNRWHTSDSPMARSASKTLFGTSWTQWLHRNEKLGLHKASVNGGLYSQESCETRTFPVFGNTVHNIQ